MQELATWTAPEFEYHPKRAHWHWASVVVAVLLIVFAVVQNNFLFALFILIAEILLLVWAEREPDMVTFTLTDRELVLHEHNKSYKHGEIESFSGYEDWSEEWSTIILDLKGHFRPSLRIHVPRHRFSEIEDEIRTVIPFVHKNESLVDILERFLGF